MQTSERTDEDTMRRLPQHSAKQAGSIAITRKHLATPILDKETHAIELLHEPQAALVFVGACPPGERLKGTGPHEPLQVCYLQSRRYASETMHLIW
jgi:hypothetical protein